MSGDSGPDLTAEAVTWAKRLMAAAGGLGVLWGAAQITVGAVQAIQTVPEAHRMARQCLTMTALNYCDLREIAPADCELPDVGVGPLAGWGGAADR